MQVGRFLHRLRAGLLSVAVVIGQQVLNTTPNV